MKQQRHKREESFSILLISNVGQGSRQFHVSRLLVKLLISVFLIICVAMACLIGFAVTSGGTMQELRAQIEEREQQVGQLQEEIEALQSENLLLASENESLQQTQEEEPPAAEETETTEEGEPEPVTDPAFPSRYPCSGSGIMTATYSEDQPYISISIRSDGNVIAAGDGTVTRVGSDDTYPLIVEVDHGNGYQTRYLCRKEAEVKTSEGAGLNIGDTLLTIQTDNTQLDYQVIYEGEIIDPLSIIDAKG